MAIKLKLAQLRKQRGFTQAQLAQALGMTLQGLQHLEYHAQSVKLDSLDKLCHKLSCTPCDLIEFKPDRSSS